MWSTTASTRTSLQLLRGELIVFAKQVMIRTRCAKRLFEAPHQGERGETTMRTARLPYAVFVVLTLIATLAAACAAPATVVVPPTVAPAATTAPTAAAPTA